MKSCSLTIRRCVWDVSLRSSSVPILRFTLCSTTPVRGSLGKEDSFARIFRENIRRSAPMNDGELEEGSWNDFPGLSLSLESLEEFFSIPDMA